MSNLWLQVVFLTIHVVAFTDQLGMYILDSSFQYSLPPFVKALHLLLLDILLSQIM